MAKTIAQYVEEGVETPQTQQGLDIIAEDADKEASQATEKPDSNNVASTKTSVKMPTRPGQQSVVTMDMVKAAGFDNLRDYLNDQKGLVRRSEKPAEKSYENMVKFDPARPSMQPLSSSQRMSDWKQRNADAGYAKGGKINLDACGVSTHIPNKKNPNW